MTLDEAIRHAEKTAEEYQRVVDTGIVFDDVTIDMMYCDDTEVIEEHLANYRRRAEEHRQLAKWLKDYKRLKEQESCEDAISRQAVLEGKVIHQSCDGIEIINSYAVPVEYIEQLSSIQPQPKTEHWIHHKEKMYECAEHWECSRCHKSTMTNPFPVDGNDYDAMYYCPKCGAKMEEVGE